MLGKPALSHSVTRSFCGLRGKPGLDSTPAPKGGSGGEPASDSHCRPQSGRASSNAPGGKALGRWARDPWLQRPCALQNVMTTLSCPEVPPEAPATVICLSPQLYKDVTLTGPAGPNPWSWCVGTVGDAYSFYGGRYAGKMRFRGCRKPPFPPIRQAICSRRGG